MRPPARQARRPALHSPGAASPTPAAAAGADPLGDGKPHPRRDLLRLAEILVRRLLEALALERHDALVAAALRALVDRHRQDALAEEIGGLPGAGAERRDLAGIEACRRAQAVGGVEIDDDHLD